MASTYKVMLMVAYLRRARDRSLTDYDESLLEPMIRRSDNDTASRIDSMLGRGPLEEPRERRRDAELRLGRQSVGDEQDDPRDQAFFMRTLEQYVPGRHWDYARNLLASITPSQRWGIGQVPVRGWNLSFKGGWGSGTGWVNHQVVRLAKDGFRIGLAVTTENSPVARVRKANARGRLPDLAARLAALAAGTASVLLGDRAPERDADDPEDQDREHHEDRQAVLEEDDEGHPREEDEEDHDSEEDRRARIEIHQPYPSFGRSSRLAVKSFTASMPNAKPPTWAT